MTERATFSLDDSNYSFLNEVGGKNKSAYINELLRKEREKVLAEAILKANQEEAEDAVYQDELVAWDVSLSDALRN